MAGAQEEIEKGFEWVRAVFRCEECEEDDDEEEGGENESVDGGPRAQEWQAGAGGVFRWASGRKGRGLIHGMQFQFRFGSLADYGFPNDTRFAKRR